MTACAYIQVARQGRVAQLRVIGRGTFTCAQVTREFAERALAQGVRRVIAELSDCETMDSTFMGTLAMMAIHGRERNAVVEIANANKKIKSVMSALGLDRVFVFSHTAPGDITWQSLCRTEGDTEDDRRTLQKTMLEAHETLADVDPNNVPKFRDVIDFLRTEVEEAQEGEAAP